MSKTPKEAENGNPVEDPEAGTTEPGAEPHNGEFPAGGGMPTGDIEALSAQLAEKDREIAELKDKYLRTLADSENARKRIRQQSEESVRIQREAVLRDLLPIVDNLERAVEAARDGSDGSNIVAGVELVLRSLMDFLRAHGVIPVAAVGLSFDPNRHEAVDHVASDAHPPNTVLSEFHRGYQIGDRILRPARVSVSKDTGGAPKGRNGGENDASDIENN